LEFNAIVCNELFQDSGAFIVKAVEYWAKTGFD
jgi:hypothetical protein